MKATTKDFSAGQTSLTVKRIQKGLLQTEKNILPWRFSLPHTAGETAKEFSTMKRKHAQFFMPHCTAKLRCGTKRTILFDSSATARSAILHTICRTSTICSLCGRILKIQTSGLQQLVQAEHIW